MAHRRPARLSLSGRMSPEEVGTAMAVLAGYHPDVPDTSAPGATEFQR